MVRPRRIHGMREAHSVLGARQHHGLLIAGLVEFKQRAAVNIREGTSFPPASNGSAGSNYTCDNAKAGE